MRSAARVGPSVDGQAALGAFAFAVSTSFANALGSLMAISESILRLI